MAMSHPANPVATAAGDVSSALHGWPPALITAVLFAGALVVATILHFVIARSMPRGILARRPVLGAAALRARRILFLALADLLLAAVAPEMPIGSGARVALQLVLSAAFIALLGWSAIVLIDALTSFKLAQRPDDIQSNVEARRHMTQWQVLRRTSHVLTIMITIAAALMVFPAVRAYGVSLLASAGAAGLVVGLAARPVLSNLIAGIQIAIAQPLRVEDAVVIDGQWGWVEEITSTYLVVRIWNWQRLVVPLAWLLEQPFQNWTRDSSELIGDVYWNVDYTVPIAAMRQKLDQIVHATPLWSGKVVALQVTDSTPHTLQVRALVSARDSGEAWDLRCLVREQMITFLQAEYPHGLPRQRVEINGMPEGAAAATGMPAA